MSIRSNALPMGEAISPQLQDVLRKNGMQAQIAMENGQYTLHVHGHDSPELSYQLSQNQYRALADGGTNSSNKKAYNTFVGIVRDNFDIPKNYVHARNANGKVTMGLHGYRTLPNSPVIGRELGMPLPHGRDMLGWTPRQQEGFHMRRVDGRLVMMDSPMVPERENGYMKPGELQSGAYGFYYKGNQQQPVQQSDPLKDLQTVVKPVEISQEPAKKYRDLIPSAVYFTNEKWQECLRSHGFTVDVENKKLIMSQYGKEYSLTDQQVQELTANSLKGDSVYHRIDLINGVIGNNFNDKLTFDILNSTNQTDLHYKGTVASVEPQVDQIQRQALQNNTVKENRIDSSIGVNGQDLDGKGWYRQTNHGREVDVGNIWVEKEPQQEGKYRTSAVINGQVVSHEISQRQYDKFLAIDDYHRMKMFDKVFDEVRMKSEHEQGNKMNFGQALMAGLGVATTLTRGAADIAHDIEHIKHPHSTPDIYEERLEQPQRHGRIYVKAGLDTPESIAARAFDAGMNQGFQNAVLHR